MPTFKPKNSKKLINSVPTMTLDGKHKQLTAEFAYDFKVRLPILQKEFQEIEQRLHNAAQNSSLLSLEQRLDLTDRLKELKKLISAIYKKETDYFLNNSKYIFDYFEHKKSIADTSTTTPNTKILNSFFQKKNLDTNHQTTEQTIVQKYFNNVDANNLDLRNYVVQNDLCTNCSKGSMTPIEHEGILVCESCNYVTPYLVDNEKPSYKEPPKEVCFYAYKRINHFREILAQFQAKETTQIPDEIIANIQLQIKKERIKLSQITNKRAKDILKKLGYNKYYEHIPFIKDKLGIKPPIMSAELEDTLCNLFMDIQAPYAKYCPDDRVNFLNYYYTVYKLCELLDQKQFLPYFPMLKDREKRIEQDEIWRNICDELDWEYIPTI
jgi:hypothetical protein